MKSPSNSVDESLSGAGAKADGPAHVAVVIAARNDKSTVAQTVRACRAIPAVDLIVVVDDGSEDETAQVARSAGAVVVRHSVSRGRSSAMETGVKVAAMRDRADWAPRHILFMDPDLGDSAIESNVLVEAVIGRVADCAVGFPTSFLTAGRRRISRTAAVALRSITGWNSTAPLATNRCISREVLNIIMPFASGSGADIGMSIDLLQEGFTIVEYPCEFERLPAIERTGDRWRARTIDIWFAIQGRRLTSFRHSKGGTPAKVEDQGIGVPYRIVTTN